MTNLSVSFTNAWWLLLLIPAVVFTLISYFQVNKRYRCTRNRIVSMVMHLLATLLAVALLSGLTVEYYKPNTEMEVILLVDRSSSSVDSEDEMDRFVRSVIDNCDSMYKLGIVKFGYDQVYAVELSTDTEQMYTNYRSAAEPDITATDLASALGYTSGLFTNPGNSRIVVLSDALETDGAARDVIKSLSAKGIKVDTVYLAEENVGYEVQIIDAKQNVPKVEIDSKFDMQVTVESSYTGTATITPYDNHVAGTPVEVELVSGKQTISIPYSFAVGGMHEVSFEIASKEDTLAENNTYVTHIYIETFTEILVIENLDDESKSLVSMLGEELNTTVVNVRDSAKMPTTLDQMRNYDEVLLVNVANGDLPVGFDQLLYEYVHDIGGGLFTVCGNTANSTEDDWTANAYTREDMFGSLYQEMLPVEIVNYTAPVGVIIVVDTSGSMMGSPYEGSKLYWAMQGAQSCLDALTERDYVGIMTLADDYTEELTLTPRTQRDKILSIIASMEEAARDGTIETGGTIFSAAMQRAGKALAARSDIEKKHIIIVTDGEPSGDDKEYYQYWAEENAKMDVTMSIVGINTTMDAKNAMVDLLVNYAGCKEENFIAVSQNDYSKLPTLMRENLEVPEIKSVNYETFTPTINTYNSVVKDIDESLMPTLDGYYGVKLKPEATAVIMGKYTPIYSQWDFGNGRVGTFACDLNGTWSEVFVESEVGAQLINNIVYALFPTENIRARDVEASYTGDNYTTNLSIFTDLKDGEYVKVTVTLPGNEQYEYLADQTSGFSRMTLALKKPGLSTILIQKLDAEDNELAHTTLYKSLPYSKEYNAFPDRTAAKELAESLAKATDGVVITDPLQVFENAVEYLHIVIDPRTAFTIALIVCFLLDVAVRKFKWKWPGEIIRDRKRRLAMTK